MLSRLIIFGLISLLTVTGCAYVEFSREYEIAGAFDNSEVNDIESFLERFFEEKGLIPIRKYTELYPSNIRYLIYEIPRALNSKRRRPTVIAIISSNKDIHLEHNEWFFSPSSKDKHPRDYLASIKDDLEYQMKRSFGKTIKMSFTKKSYY